MDESEVRGELGVGHRRQSAITVIRKRSLKMTGHRLREDLVKLNSLY